MPYSSTISSQNQGVLSYASADVGKTIITDRRYRVGMFVGYGYMLEKTNAYGCAQISSNPFICVPTINDGVLGISEDTQWQWARLGIVGDVWLAPRIKLTAEFAWVPYAQMNGWDTHWLRLGSSFTGAIPETGHGTGYQVEALLSYQFTDRFSVGLGGRYWYLQTNGTADFTTAAIGGGEQQSLNFWTSRYGAFLQAKYCFGPF
jgi:outer membrane protease